MKEERAGLSGPLLLQTFRGKHLAARLFVANGKQFAGGHPATGGRGGADQQMPTVAPMLLPQ